MYLQYPKLNVSRFNHLFGLMTINIKSKAIVSESSFIKIIDNQKEKKHL